MVLELVVRRQVTKAMLSRYAKGSRAEKGEVLDQLVAVTGWHRDHARKALRRAAAAPASPASPSPPSPRREPVLTYGQPVVDALVTSVGVENRAFFALSVGTSPADAKVVANNVMPLSEPLPVVGEARSFELPAMAVDVPAGSTLFLTVSPVSDMFFSHGSRTPGALVLESTVVRLPVVGS